MQHHLQKHTAPRPGVFLCKEAQAKRLLQQAGGSGDSLEV